MAINLGLKDPHFKWIAERINCEPEMVISFSKVECKRPPFDADGFPAILFERHIFYRNLPREMRAQVARDHPDLCAPKGYGPGGYGTYAQQRGKFNRAFAIHPDAAMEACSWGAFQELGENWHDYGFARVGDFVDAMKNGLRGQCEIFIKSIKHRGLQDEMQRRDFPTLARLYNGAGYRKFNYDGQIHDEYNIARNRRVNWDKVEAAPPPSRGGTEELPIIHPDPTYPNIEHVPDEHQDAEDTTDPPAIDPPEVDDENAGTKTQQAPGASVEIDPSGGVKIDATGGTSTPGPKEKIAIEKPKPSGFVDGIWKRITGLFGGNVGLDALVDKAQQVSALGLSPAAWEKIGTLALIGSGIYLAFYAWHWWSNHRRDKELTLSLIKENSTADNFVQLISKDQIPEFKERGYKIITR
jgi:hypothetical protein